MEQSEEKAGSLQAIAITDRVHSRGAQKVRRQRAVPIVREIPLLFNSQKDHKGKTVKVTLCRCVSWRDLGKR